MYHYVSLKCVELPVNTYRYYKCISPEGILRFTNPLPVPPPPPPPLPTRALRDRYQNVPQDVNFDILDVPQENNISEIWVSEHFCTTA